MIRTPRAIATGLFLVVLVASACAPPRRFHDANMDFGSVKTVAILPFQNLSRENTAAEQVRDTLFAALLATKAVYVLPPGEVSRAIARVGVTNPTTPTVEEATRLGTLLKVDGLITGVVREFGEIRSGGGSAPVVSLSAQMIEASSGKVVWSGTSTRGGLTITDRLLGSGGRPTNPVTEAAVDDLLDQLFK
jgi:polysaccharide biosynthesis protein PelC